MLCVKRNRSASFKKSVEEFSSESNDTLLS